MGGVGIIPVEQTATTGGNSQFQRRLRAVTRTADLPTASFPFFFFFFPSLSSFLFQARFLVVGGLGRFGTERMEGSVRSKTSKGRVG